MKRLLKVVGWLCGGAVGLLLGLAGVLAVQRMRTVTLPAPRGPHAVGRLLQEWTDSTREETLSPLGGRRRLAVWIWYPARPGGRPAPYLPPRWARALREQRPLPGGLLFQASWSIHPHALEGAAPADRGEPFPVLVFEPGMTKSAADYTTLAEDLASRGYVVVGLNPTYSPALTLLDGQRVPPTRAGRLPDPSLPVEQYDHDVAGLMEVWAADDRFAMSRLARLQGEPGPLHGRLDVRAFGLWGHSFGGAAAWRACRSDARCAGAVNLDGDLFGVVANRGEDRPVLFVGNEGRAGHLRPDIARVLARSPDGVLRVLPGALHANFVDHAVEPVHRLPLLRTYFWGVGTMDGARGLTWTADELDAFFEPVLRRGAPPPRPAG